MILKKLDTGDVLRNTIKVYPKNSVFVDATGSQYNKSLGLMTPASGSNPFLLAGNSLYLSASNLEGLAYTASVDTVPTNASVGLLTSRNASYNTLNFSFNRPLTSSISLIHVTKSDSTNYDKPSSNTGYTQRLKINALRNTLDWYSSVADDYNFNYYTASAVSIINIPSIFYGKSIKRGSVELNFYITGTLIGTLKDENEDGRLIQTYPGGETYGSSSGVVLYEEGFFLLTGSWALSTASVDDYIYEENDDTGITTNSDMPRWIHFCKSMNTNLNSSSYEINFSGSDSINTLTIFAHAAKNEFNGSNNITFIEHSNLTGSTVFTSSMYYAENPQLEIVNTVKTSYETVSGSFKKQTFINKIGIFDKDKRLIAIAKLATPVKKNNERDYTFKLKLDI